MPPARPPCASSHSKCQEVDYRPARRAKASTVALVGSLGCLERVTESEHELPRCARQCDELHVSRETDTAIATHACCRRNGALDRACGSRYVHVRPRLSRPRLRSVGRLSSFQSQRRRTKKADLDGGGLGCTRLGVGGKPFFILDVSRKYAAQRPCSRVRITRYRDTPDEHNRKHSDTGLSIALSIGMRARRTYFVPSREHERKSTTHGELSKLRAWT